MMTRRIKTETARARAAFDLWVSLGDYRTYAIVAEQSRVSLGSIKLWAKCHRWRERLAEERTLTAKRAGVYVKGIDDTARLFLQGFIEGFRRACALPSGDETLSRCAVCGTWFLRKQRTRFCTTDCQSRYLKAMSQFSEYGGDGDKIALLSAALTTLNSKLLEVSRGTKNGKANDDA